MSEPVVITFDSEAATDEAASRLGRALRGGEVIALDGPLGSGKTCFVRGIARGLGIDPGAVSSPTFVILHEYESPSGLMLAHLDAYRIGDVDELDAIGWQDLVEAPDVVIAVEWAERIAPALPAARLALAFEHAGPTTRRVTARGSIRSSSGAMLREALSGGGASPCPTCGRDVARDAPTSPFCSTRCRMADLHRWFSGAYRLERPLETEDFDE